MIEALSPSAATESPLVLYDGECGFCNASVQFVLKHEKSPVLRFAPLQGETGRQLLKASSLPADIGDNTIVFHHDGQFLIRSQAALQILRHMGGPWAKLAGMIKFIPRPIADTAYRVVARFRKYLPAKGSCALLPPEQRKRFLP